jgi:hypothetical protein
MRLKKKVSLATAASMLGWVGYSYANINKPIPPVEETDAYGRSLMSRFGQEDLGAPGGKRCSTSATMICSYITSSRSPMTR